MGRHNDKYSIVVLCFPASMSHVHAIHAGNQQRLTRGPSRGSGRVKEVVIWNLDEFGTGVILEDEIVQDTES